MEVFPIFFQLRCPAGQHNVMSSIFFKTPEASLIAILHDANGKKHGHALNWLSVEVILNNF